MRNFRKKYFRFCANCAKKIAQNRAKLIAFHAQKKRKSSQKKICAKIAQILRKRFSHFVETLDQMVLHIKVSLNLTRFTRAIFCWGVGWGGSETRPSMILPMTLLALRSGECD